METDKPADFNQIKLQFEGVGTGGKPEKLKNPWSKGGGGEPTANSTHMRSQVWELILGHRGGGQTLIDFARVTRRLWIQIQLKTDFFFGSILQLF